jgi:4'-phosphopantetheinyl transferase EntD
MFKRESSWRGLRKHSGALSSIPQTRGKRQAVQCVAVCARAWRCSVKIALGFPEVIIVESSPAQLSRNLSRLFAADARVAELRGPGDPRLLLPAEAQFLGRSVAKRAQEFAAGRVCARRALADLGYEHFAVKRGADRQPIWPQGIVGSITHTVGFCAAVVAPSGTAVAIGLDSEVAGGTPPGGSARDGSARDGVKPHLWPSICVASEIEWLGTLPESQRVAAATLIFSAKEAFYKCQYPLTQERLGFHDARVEVGEWNRQFGSFSISATRAIAFAAHAPLPMSGRFSFHEEFVSAGLFVAAGTSKPSRRGTP